MRFLPQNIEHKSSQTPSMTKYSLTICVCFMFVQQDLPNQQPFKIKRTDYTYKSVCALRPASLNYDFLCRCGSFSDVGASPSLSRGEERLNSAVFVRASSRHALIVTPDIVTHGAM